MRLRSRGAGVGLALLLVLTGCGGGDDDDADGAAAGGAVTTTTADDSDDGAPSATTPDPCTLVTVEEVSAALGSPIDPPEGTDFGPPLGGRQCLFINTDAPPIKTFQVVVRSDGDFAENLRDAGQSVEKLYQDTKNLQEGAEDVSGLGDEAYKTKSAYYVLKDGVSLETNLGLNSDPSPAAIAALATLTDKAVSRI